eukprot:Clim_evm23s119 gene=Clim_evmTU23s119
MKYLAFTALLGASAISAAMVPMTAWGGPEYDIEGLEFANRMLVLPDNWSYVGPVSDFGHELTVTFAVKQQNMDVLEDIFWSVSDPDNDAYQHYLTVSQIADIIRPKREAIEAVESFLASHNIEVQHKTQAEDLITATFPLDVAKEAFDCEFHHFAHPEIDQTVVRTLAYRVPESLAEHLDDISGLMYLMSPRGVQITSMSLDTEDGPPKMRNITPKVIYDTYGVDYSASNSTTTQAIASFIGQHFSADDLAQFQETFHIQSHPIDKLIGSNDGRAGLEANLDVQYITGIGQGITTWHVYTQQGFLQWVSKQVDTDDSPWVHSVSYGESEAYDFQENPARLNKEFMKFGTMGRTVLYASGDSGVGCRGIIHWKFDPDFPASSPYVTAVGGVDGKTKGWTGSGGGFSNQFKRPAWQKKTVKYFLDNSQDLPPAFYWNSTGRGYPDISAFSTDFVIVMNGQLVGVSGTSAAAPTIAGIISLLNDVSFNNGGASLGFVNPLLYKMYDEDPKAFHDIKEGRNIFRVCLGFKAMKGWDPITGLGTPNFPKMREYVQKQAEKRQHVIGGWRHIQAQEGNDPLKIFRPN